jgi:hypothetical protein
MFEKALALALHDNSSHRTRRAGANFRSEWGFFVLDERRIAKALSNLAGI